MSISTCRYLSRKVDQEMLTPLGIGVESWWRVHGYSFYFTFYLSMSFEIFIIISFEEKNLNGKRSQAFLQKVGSSYCKETTLCNFQAGFAKVTLSSIYEKSVQAEGTSV